MAAELTKLQALFRDAMDWGRSYGQRLNLTDMTLDDVSMGFAEKAAALATQGAEPVATVHILRTLHSERMVAHFDTILPEGTKRFITIEIEDDEVLVALKRPEDYEDVHPELVAEDAIKETWPGYRTVKIEENGHDQ